MESIKKLEEQLMMNQRSSGSEKVMNGPRDDGSDLTSNKKVYILSSTIIKICYSVVLHYLIFTYNPI